MPNDVIVAICPLWHHFRHPPASSVNIPPPPSFFDLPLPSQASSVLLSPPSLAYLLHLSPDFFVPLKPPPSLSRTELSVLKHACERHIFTFRICAASDAPPPGSRGYCARRACEMPALVVINCGTSLAVLAHWRWGSDGVPQWGRGHRGANPVPLGVAR